jgi:hypothetical protein
MEAESKARREAAHVRLLQKAAQAANQARDVDDAVRAAWSSFASTSAGQSVMPFCREITTKIVRTERWS